MLSIEPALPMLRIEPALPMDKIEPALPMLRTLPTLRMLPTLQKLRTLNKLLALKIPARGLRRWCATTCDPALTVRTCAWLTPAYSRYVFPY
jgi:hypothetical protein